MFKRLISSSMLIILCLALTGFDKKINNSSHVIEHKSDWNNLFVEGYEIDLKAADFAEKKLKGGYYDNDLHAVIPCDVPQIEKEWKKAKDRIARVIGPIPNLSTKNSFLWENSSKSVDDLLFDANSLAPFFKESFQNIALAVKGRVNFGPGDQSLIKSHESLINKVNRDASDLHLSEEEAIAKIGDTIRGTIIVDDLDKIPEVIVEILDYVDQHEAKVVFKNMWKEDRESGYIGIHAKLLLPLPQTEAFAEKRYILAEMQIHLNSIVDGTAQSAKERAHVIYEQVRLEEIYLPTLAAASKLIFLTAMQDILKALDKKETFASLSYD